MNPEVSPTPSGQLTPDPISNPAFLSTPRGKLVVGAAVVAVIAAAVGGWWYMNAQKPAAKDAAPGYVTTKDDPNTITVWAWSTAAKALQEVVPDFQAKYPDIKVKVVEIPYAEANNKFKTAVATGVGVPDVWDSEGTMTAEYIKKGTLLDITDRASRYKADFVDYKWGEVSSENKIYALPWDTAPAGMFYRRDLFAAAGVDPAKILTWEDYIAAGKKVTKDTNGDGKPDQYMTLMSKKTDVHETFQIILSQYGGSEFDAKGNPTLNSPQGVKTVQLMKQMLDAGIGAEIGWWSPEFFNAIKSGQIASLASGVWMGGQIKDTAPDTSGKWGVMPLPATVAGGSRTAVRGGSNLAVPAKSKKADKAWKFIEFALANKDSQLKMYKKYNISPALKSAYTDPIFNEADAFFGGQKTSQVFMTAQNALSGTFHYGPIYLESNQIISAEVLSALTGVKTPAEALNDAEQKIKSEL